MINNKEKIYKIGNQLFYDIDELLKYLNCFLEENFKDLGISNYHYKIDNAIDELYLDEETIRELVEDFIIQILNSKSIFHKYIKNLEKNKQYGLEPDYTDIGILAHKNLGAAKNLRIVDSQKLLEIIMYENDLERLKLCVEALELCAVRLNPFVVCNTLKLIEIEDA